MTKNEKFLYAKQVLDNPLFKEVFEEEKEKLFKELLNNKDGNHSESVARLKELESIKKKFKFYLELEKTNRVRREYV